MDLPFLRHQAYAALVRRLLRYLCDERQDADLTPGLCLTAAQLREDLTAGERDALYGVYVLELSVVKIACEMSIDPARVYAFRRRGDKRVKELLQHCEDAPWDVRAYCRDEPPDKTRGRYDSRLTVQELELLEQAAHPERDAWLIHGRQILVSETRRRLTPRQMAYLSGYYLHGQTIEAVAARHRVNKSTVSRGLAEGRKRLCGAMELIYKIEARNGGSL